MKINEDQPQFTFTIRTPELDARARRHRRTRRSILLIGFAAAILAPSPIAAMRHVYGARGLPMRADLVRLTAQALRAASQHGGRGERSLPWNLTGGGSASTSARNGGGAVSHKRHSHRQSASRFAQSVRSRRGRERRTTPTRLRLSKTAYRGSRGLSLAYLLAANLAPQTRTLPRYRPRGRNCPPTRAPYSQSLQLRPPSGDR